jgi:DNA-binding transcriptional regulator of glucitol operon
VGVSRWFSRRSLLLHLAVVVWVPGCGVAAWWQVTVALAGNSLGWLYAVEWPVFAVLGVCGWWQLVHDDPETVRERRAARKGRAIEPRADAPPAGESLVEEQRAEDAAPALTAEAVTAIHRAEGADEHLAAYNAYLATLATTGRRKSWRDPTGAGDRS